MNQPRQAEPRGLNWTALILAFATAAAVAVVLRVCFTLACVYQQTVTRAVEYARPDGIS